MAEITLKGYNEKESITIIHIDSENIPAGDIPYYVVLEKLKSGQPKVEFQFMNNAESKKQYINEIVSVIYGENSGKVYVFELKPNTYINSNRLKRVRKEILTVGNNQRFKNNVATFFEVINEIFNSVTIEYNSIEKTTTSTNTGHKKLQRK